jgi:hypothetical protein
MTAYISGRVSRARRSMSGDSTESQVCREGSWAFSARIISTLCSRWVSGGAQSMTSVTSLIAITARPGVWRSSPIRVRLAAGIRSDGVDA